MGAVSALFTVARGDQETAHCGPALGEVLSFLLPEAAIGPRQQSYLCFIIIQLGSCEGERGTAGQGLFINPHFQKTLCGLAPKSRCDIHHLPLWIFLSVLSGQAIVLCSFWPFL